MSGLTWAFLLVVTLPATALYTCLPHMDLNARGHLPLLGEAATKATATTHISLQIMTLLSWALIVVGYKVAGGVTRPCSTPAPYHSKVIHYRAWLVSGIICVIAGTSIVILAKTLKQDSLRELVSFIMSNYRVNWGTDSRGFWDSLAFSFINSMLSLSLLPLTIQTNWRISRFIVSVPLAVLLMLMCGSRRAAIVLMLVLLMSQLSRSRRVAIFLAFFLPLVAITMVLFGRSILSRLGDGDRSQTEVVSEQTWDHAGYIASELAISHTESLSTLIWFDHWPRLGVDHILSVLRLLPEQSILGSEFAERFTRHATYMHIGDASANDIPVGFIGAVWVDGYWLGIFVLPMVLGLFAAKFDHWIHSRVGMSGTGWYAIAYLNYVIFFQTLNSGTLDFTLSPTTVIAGALCAFLLSGHPGKQRAAVSVGSNGKSARSIRR